MTDPRRIESLLSTRAREIFDEDAVDHLDDRAIETKIAAGTPFSDAEIAHLGACAECRDVAAAFARAQRSERDNVRWLWVAPVLAAAASLLFFFYPAEPPRTKGNAELGAEVSLIAVDAANKRRDLRDRDTITTADRLGFKFGNPGDERPLSILAWDGARLHWYYPEGPNAPTHRVAGQELQKTLPFEVELDDHRPGPLIIAAAFDLPAGEIAQTLERDPRALEQKEGVQIFHLQLTEARR